MKKILLVEPNYKNKYPPIGLMKLSTYYKNKGDFVEFHKGLLPSEEVKTFDNVLITTLFTFDFKMCVQTIRYYISLVGTENVFVGGIAATIMPDKFLDEIPEVTLLTGQLTSSCRLGYKDNINIDILALDYDMLYDTSYVYPMENSYFIHASRGCPRRCDFCAVKDLEPHFYDCDNIYEQIMQVNMKYGIKKNLLIMDNNILFSKRLQLIVDALVALGFGIDNNQARKNSQMKYYLESLFERIKDGRKTNNILKRIIDEFNDLKFSRINHNDKIILEDIIAVIKGSNKIKIIDKLFSNRNFLISFYDKYHYHKVTRYVDFNQGLDARLFTNKKAIQLSRLALKPCRIAFDDLKTRIQYFNAMELAAQNGINHFSNYLLYNYDEKPRDLWVRLYLNIQFCKEHEGINLFSFPMKYAAIDMIDRNYVGKYWNKKYLRAMNVVLNVTKGVVPKEEDFFLRAYGRNEIEFLEILSMPDDYIRYRDFFEKNGYTEQWKKLYKELSLDKKKELLDILSSMVDSPEVINNQLEAEIKNILWFYQIRKTAIDNNPKYYESKLSEIQNNNKCSKDLIIKINE